MKKLLILFSASLVLGFALLGPQALLIAYSQTQNQPAPKLGTSPTPDAVATAHIGEEVRHELAMMPYYSVFDWIEGQVMPKETVVLRGQVTRPTTRSDAEARVKRIESVAKVDNQIETLPLSPSDDAIRVATYRALFKYEGPLFRYSTQARTPIHIIVKNGRVTLKGVVADETDKQIAYTYARGVPNVFEVKNELNVVKDAL